MAMARCETCGVPNGRTKTYSATPYHPVGHPMSGVICGRPECRALAVIWLTLDEELQYQQGERIFRMDTNSVKVAVQ